MKSTGCNRRGRSASGRALRAASGPARRSAGLALNLALGLALSLAGGGLASGCREPGEGRPAGGRAAPSLAPTAPPSVAPVRPTAQTAPVATDVGSALAAAAATCFPGDRFDRRCPAFAQLRETTRLRAADTGWQAALQGRIDAAGPEGRLALEVVLEGASPVTPEGSEALRGRLWRVVDDDGRAPDQRAQAVRLLARLAGPEDVDRLVALLSAEVPPTVRAAAGYALAEPTPALVDGRARSVPALLAALKAEASGEAARGTIHSLGALRVEAAAALLVERLDDALVGATATLALSGLRDPRAFSAVLSRIEAGAAGQGPVSPALLSALQSLESHPAFDAARVRAAVAGLAQTLEPQGADPLVAVTLDLARQTLRRLDALAAQPAAESGAERAPGASPAREPGPRPRRP